MLRVKLRGRYEIIKELGSGGFSETYLARDLDFPGQPRCVVKQLKPHCDDDWGLQTARRLFDSEATVLSRLGSNEQIPQLMAYFEENQQFYLVQEFIEGHQLSEELDPERQWTEGQAISFLEDALGVLAFIHRHDVVHRDLKPENIIRRSADSRLVFIDFGAIKEVTGESSSTESNLTIAVGTPAYMPIEQQSGKPRLNSDIYAIGLIAIQGLTGVSPKYLPEDAQTGEFLWRDLAQVSEPLAGILNGMVRWNFRDRYQSAEEVLTDLQPCRRFVMGSAERQQPSTEKAAKTAIGEPDPFDAAFERVVRALERHPERSRIRKLLFCAFAGYWENDPEQLEVYATDEVLSALHQAHPTLTEFSDTLYAVVKTLNKQAKYFSVFNVLIHHVSSIYPSEGQGKAGDAPSEPASLGLMSAPSSAADDPSELSEPIPSFEEFVRREKESKENQSAPPIAEPPAVIPGDRHPAAAADSERDGRLAYDPFELRAEVIRYTTPLRAKIVLFSLLYFQFGYGGQDWSALMTHNLDDLIEKALQEYKHIDELEARLHRVANGFGSDRQAATQAATAIAQALQIAYDHR